MAGNAVSGPSGLEGVNSNRLFLGSCLSLISTSVAFGVVTSLMGDLKSVFNLTNTEAGWIGGATIWGFTISIFIFGPLCNILGMRRLMRVSMLLHFVGPLLMIFANGFPMLILGGLCIALANGTVEAVCNPLVATIYPDRKTQKLNQFHVWFPGGIVIGGLLAYFIDQLGIGGSHAWQVKLSLILIPTVLYGIVFAGQKFPPTERAQSGVSFGNMMAATFLRPLFLILFVCMGITASLELGPGRWMGEVMNDAMGTFAGDKAGILVLVYGSGLMAVLRFFAGPVVHRLSPTGLLVASAILGGLGLFSLSMVSNVLGVFVAATIFYVGVCYFWPTMLGVAGERVPKGGELALAILGGWGMAVVGLITVPVMGAITDSYGLRTLDYAETRTVIQDGVSLVEATQARGGEAARGADQALVEIRTVIGELGQGDGLPMDTAKALRSIEKYAAGTDVGSRAAVLAKEADKAGFPFSFRWVSASAIFLVIVFGVLYVKDLSKGGYKSVHIND